jgi:hypothetical protein
MMDQLDRLRGDAMSLLGRVDDILAATGAPSGHRVWEPLRRVRLLTVDAVAAVAALRPAEFAAEAPDLRGRATAYVEAAARLPAPDTWSGEAADAYDSARRRLADQLNGDPDSLAERLEASADLVDALVDWMRRSKSAVAGCLAGVLGSAEAVLLLTADHAVAPVSEAEVLAAADVADLVLRTIAEVYDEASELLDAAGDLAVPTAPPARFAADWS